MHELHRDSVYYLHYSIKNTIEQFIKSIKYYAINRNIYIQTSLIIVCSLDWTFKHLQHAGNRKHIDHRLWHWSGAQMCQMNEWCVINSPGLQGKVVPTVSTPKSPLLSLDRHHSITFKAQKSLWRSGRGSVVWKWLVSVQKQGDTNFPWEAFKCF